MENQTQSFQNYYVPSRTILEGLVPQDENTKKEFEEILRKMKDDLGEEGFRYLSSNQAEESFNFEESNFSKSEEELRPGSLASDNVNTAGTETDLELRIWKGQQAERGEFPYQLHLHHPRGKCGGVLIGDEWLLTAAHCFVKYHSVGWIAIAGQHLRYEDEPTKQFRNITTTFIHPDFDRQSFSYDIAIGRVDEKFTLTPYVKPIKLAQYQVPVHTACILTGWGISDVTDYPSSPAVGIGFRPNELRKVTTYVAPRDICDHPPTPTKLCTYDANSLGKEYKGVCSGDSGGPLTCKNGEDLMLSAVVVAANANCAWGTFWEPISVYTDVAVVNEWIVNITGFDEGSNSTE